MPKAFSFGFAADDVDELSPMEDCAGPQTDVVQSGENVVHPELCILQDMVSSLACLPLRPFMRPRLGSPLSLWLSTSRPNGSLIPAPDLSFQHFFQHRFRSEPWWDIH